MMMCQFAQAARKVQQPPINVEIVAKCYAIPVLEHTNELELPRNIQLSDLVVKLTTF